MMGKTNGHFRATLWIFLFLLVIPSTGYAESFEARVGSMSWNEILTEARGQSVNWYMWGGNEAITRWVGGYLKDRLAEEFGVTLNMVPLKEVKKAVDKVRSERRQGIYFKGSIDLIWINGENFRLLKQGEMLFQFAHKLPNSHINSTYPNVVLYCLRS